MLMSLIFLWAAATAAALPQFADPISAAWVNSTAQQEAVPFYLGAVERGLEPRQCAGMRICDGRACMPNGATCCRGGRYCAGDELCYSVRGTTCCKKGWAPCVANDGSGTVGCYPFGSGAMCCSSGHYCERGTYCLKGGGCCPDFKVCRGGSGWGGAGDGGSMDPGSDSDNKPETTEERKPETTEERSTATTVWSETEEWAAATESSTTGEETTVSDSNWPGVASSTAASAPSTVSGSNDTASSGALSALGAQTTIPRLASSSGVAVRSSGLPPLASASVSVAPIAIAAAAPLIPHVFAVVGAIGVGLMWQ